MDQEMLKLAEEYAVIAEELLEENGMPYDEDDVIKVASFLIDNEVDFEDEDDDEEEFDEEDVRLAAFYDELEKDAGKLGKRISGHLYNTGVGLSNKLWGKGPKKGAKLNWRQNLARKMVKTNKNARRTGAAVYGAGALAAGGAGYGAYRMTKKSSFFEEDGFDKEAAKMRLGKRISGHLYNTGVGLSNKLWGKGPKKGAKLNWRQNLARKMVKTNKNARRTGAAVYGAGALAAGGAGYGIYRGTRKNK